MARNDDSERRDARSSNEERPQDPHVERVAPDPSQPAQTGMTLRGLWGESDREGFRRLYFTRNLDQFAEFRAEDVLYTEPLPAEQPPLVGLDTTSVTVRKGADVEYSRISPAEETPDAFDFDVRAAPTAAGSLLPLTVWTYPACQPNTVSPCHTGPTQVGCYTSPEFPTCGSTCQGGTCEGYGTCGTCPPTCPNTCNTCMTNCAQQTCRQTCQTCHTNCGQHTCGDVTCQTCNQRTCPAVCVPLPTQGICPTRFQECW